MCRFLAPAGQPEMMHKNFMHWHLRFFVVQHACMKFFAKYFKYTLDTQYYVMYSIMRKGA